MSYVNNVGIYLTRAVELIPRPRFGKFLILENLKYKILQAAKRKEETFPDLVISYISAAFFIPKILLKHIRWEFTILLFSLASDRMSPRMDIPLLKQHKQKKEKDAWDYEGRGYAMYIHILARTYGWTQKQIDNLRIEDALMLVQEVITDEQLDREFLWSMSENSYIYNPKTKSGKPNPLERPYFMKAEVQAPKKISIPKNMLPAGVSYDSIPVEFRPR